jgi:hypothetical protein
MAKVIVEMFATAADEGRILERGKFYAIDADDAAVLCTPNHQWGEQYARLAPECPRNKLTPIPATPDPDDKGESAAELDD